MKSKKHNRTIILKTKKVIDPVSLDIHPAANLFPMLSKAELQNLADDIKKNGLVEPILRYKGQILDGRNRLAACELAVVKPRFEEWKGEGSPIPLNMSLNLHRRHLNESQRSMVAAKLKEHLQKEDKNRANLRTSKKATKEAARAMNVSPRSVESATKILKKGTPKLQAAVEKGDIAVSTAAKQVSSPPKDEKVSVVYARVTEEQGSDEWLTPKFIVDSIGIADLDPCAAPEGRAWSTAKEHYTKGDGGLEKHWRGFVWCNPPYTKPDPWLKKLTAHGNGIALVMASTDTEWFQDAVTKSSGLLFHAGRIKFCRLSGIQSSETPKFASVFMAFGDEAKKRLRESGLKGFFVEMSATCTNVQEATCATSN